jgi:endoglucanase
MVILALLGTLTVMAAGCTKDTEIEEKDGSTDFTSMEEAPVLSYEVPVSTPGILVNQTGYLTDSTKTAVFQGEEMPLVFHVISAESGEVVYTGNLQEKRYESEAGEYISYGDFTEVTQEGTYYIEAPVLGMSYTFAIGDDVYDEIFREACRQYYYNRCGMTLTGQYAGDNAHNACHTAKTQLREDTAVSIDVTGGWHQDEKGQKDVVSAAKTMSDMLLAYELYGSVFTDDTGIPESGNEIPDILDEIRYEADWLLKMQDQQTGAVYQGITIYQSVSTSTVKTGEAYVEPADTQAEKAFAMALAKFSYLYQSYDKEYALTCLKAADRAFKYAQLDEKNEQDSWYLAAAAELYRATGQSNYQKLITELLKDASLDEKQDEAGLLGCVTYIATKQSVDRELCEKIMEMLMTRAEEISAAARSGAYLVSEEDGQDLSSGLMLDMMYLGVVNHIISNYEYETTIENHLHYLMGRNDRARFYIETTTDKDQGSVGIMKQFETDSKFIFMLSEIAGH